MILSLHGGHNASAAVVKKEVVGLRCWCIESERIDRIKMSCGCEVYKGTDFSPKAKSEWIRTKKSDLTMLIDRVLKEAGASLSDVDLVVISQNTDIDRLPEELRSLPIENVSHHRAHAALAYYTSNFDEALVVVCDGSGEHTEDGFETQTAWSCHGSEMTRIATTYKKSTYNMGIGNAYELFTYWLGYGYNGCGTTMALASFSENICYTPYDIFSYNKNGDVFLNSNFVDVEKHIRSIKYKKHGTMAYNIEHENAMRSIPLPNGYVLRNYGESSVRPEFIQMAVDIQNATEEVVMKYVQQMHQKHPEHKYLCCGGGTFLNCNLNSKLRRLKWVNDIYVPTAPGDGGLSLGAALSVYFKTHEKCNVYPTAFIGTKIEPISIYDDSIVCTMPEDIYAHTAKMISEGMLVGWCQGRAEFGPRALGHRSLIADPRRKDIPDKINSMLKHREPFRPFAPAVLEDKFSMCFKGDMPIPYMLETRQIQEDWLQKIPAVCHVDNSARVQVVNENNCPEFYLLLRSFEKITGVPVLVNTSLNRNGEPIVDSSYDALALLHNKMVDALVIGDRVYFRKESN